MFDLVVFVESAARILDIGIHEKCFLWGLGCKWIVSAVFQRQFREEINKKFMKVMVIVNSVLLLVFSSTACTVSGNMVANAVHHYEHFCHFHNHHNFNDEFQSVYISLIQYIDHRPSFTSGEHLYFLRYYQNIQRSVRFAWMSYFQCLTNKSTKSAHMCNMWPQRKFLETELTLWISLITKNNLTQLKC